MQYLQKDLIKYEGSLVQRVGAAINVTKKLLTLSERQKIIEFFISNSDLFKKLISHFYPLNFVHLNKFQNF